MATCSLTSVVEFTAYVMKRSFRSKMLPGSSMQFSDHEIVEHLPLVVWIPIGQTSGPKKIGCAFLDQVTSGWRERETAGKFSTFFNARIGLLQVSLRTVSSEWSLSSFPQKVGQGAPACSQCCRDSNTFRKL